MSDDPAVVQAEFLARDIVEYLLNDKGMPVNGYTDVLPGLLRDVPRRERQCLREPSFQQARRQIVGGCQFIMHQHGVEIEQVCMKVDVGDEHLYSNVKEALATIWKEPQNWGRLVSLFLAAYYLCKRIFDEEGKGSKKIDSVIGWLAAFLRENVVPWVVERGGFVSISTASQLGARVPSRPLVSNVRRPLVSATKSAILKVSGASWCPAQCSWWWLTTRALSARI